MNKPAKRIIARKGLICICLTLLFFISPAKAEWLRNKQPVTDSSWAKTKGKFGAVLFFTEEKNELFEIWLEDTEYVDIDIDTEKAIKRNVPIAALIIFSNCTSDKNGMANVVVSYTVYGPDGDIYVKRDEVEVWVDKPALPERILELSVDYMEMVFDKSHPSGFYSVKALVHDKNAHITLELERKFQLID